MLINFFNQLYFFKNIWFPILLGLVVFYFLFGWDILNPHSIDWLLQGNNQDSVQHFVGWEFFRYEPWHIPLGLIENYGTPIATSIVYTDSIPLFAVFFKCINHYLPDQFQYFGLWFALCFILQAAFAWLLISRMTQHIVIRLMITLFFLISPIMLNRIVQHQALAAQWVLLAALYFYLQPYRNNLPRRWLILNSVVLLIHAYLAVMVWMIWIAFLLKNSIFTRQISKTKTILYFTQTNILLLCLAWCSGYFILGLPAVQAGGYPLNAMNLLAPILPGNWFPILPGNWSRLLPSYQTLTDVQQYEGNNYFGLGFLSLLIPGCYYTIKNWRMRVTDIAELLPLTCTFIFFFLYAISNQITWGQHIVFLYSLPKKIHFMTDIFRDSGRFFWPVYYSSMLVIFYMICQYCKKNRAIFILLLAMTLQIFDLSLELHQLHDFFRLKYSTTAWPNQDFFHQARGKYRKIIFLPPVLRPDIRVKNFEQYVFYAAHNHLTINNGYFARFDQTKMTRVSKQYMRTVAEYPLENDAIYIVTNFHLFGHIQKKLSPQDKVIHSGSYLIIAPNWYS